MVRASWIVARVALLSFLASISCKTSDSTSQVQAGPPADINELVRKSSLTEWCKARKGLPEDFRRLLSYFDGRFEEAFSNPGYLEAALPFVIQNQIQATYPPKMRGEPLRAYLFDANPKLDLPAIPYKKYHDITSRPSAEYCPFLENFYRRLNRFGSTAVTQNSLVILLSVPWIEYLDMEMAEVFDASSLEVNLPPRGKLVNVALANQRIGPGNRPKCSPRMIAANACSGTDK